MGEVYRATDTALARDVAIKVLPAPFARDPDRLHRFEREARALAALNHPHIAAIYGFQSADDVPAIILELVEGPTLAQRISNGSVPVREALSLARQIAEALAAAHERGIVHRDLKPANIKLTSDGRAKVLDFGLVKMLSEGASSPDQSHSPTVTAVNTKDGVILGTAAYMSPEQARGQAVDRRTDLWSFGCVLYEMLTGHALFDRDTASDTIAAILDRDPDWSRLPPQTPASIRTLLRRCLEKDGRRRLDSATVAQLEIADALENPAAEPGVSRRGGHPSGLLIAGTIGAAIAALVTAWLLPRAPIATTAAALRFSIVPRPEQALSVPGFRRSIAISPDGRYLAYIGGTGDIEGGPLMVRRLDELDAHAIPGVMDAGEPVFSPDSQWIAFVAGNNIIQKVPVGGGSVVQVFRSGAVVGSPSWTDDGAIVFSTLDPATGLLRVSANGGEPIVLTRPDRAAHEADHTSGSVMPRGRGILFAIDADDSSSQVAVLELTTGRYKRLMPGISPRYVELADRSNPVGYVVYGSEGALRAVQFDSSRLEVVGAPITLAENVHTTPTRKVNFAASETGTLVYMPAAEPRASSLVWVDRTGHAIPVKAAPHQPYLGARLSPNGSLAALAIGGRDPRLATWNFATETFTQVTFGPGVVVWPAWTPDGKALVFGSTRASAAFNLFRQAVDGSGTVEQLTTGASQIYSQDVLPDGTRVLATELRTSGNAVVLVPSTPDRRVAPTTILQGAWPRLAPNGRFIAYESLESGRIEILVRPFPRVDDGQWRVSTAGGTNVAWSRDGRQLFYLDPSLSLMAVPVDAGGAAFSAGAPVKLFDASPFDRAGFDVSMDGQRFLMLKPEARPADAAPASLVVATDSFNAFRSQVSGR